MAKKNLSIEWSFCNFRYWTFYAVCLFNYAAYLSGKRDTYTDTFPPHAEGAD